jgi:hypothetical protein
MKTIKSIKFNKFRTSDFHNQGGYDHEKNEYIAEETLMVYHHGWYGARSHDDNLRMHGYTYGHYAIVQIHDIRKTVAEHKLYNEDGKWHVFQYSKDANLLDTQSGEAFHGTLMKRFKTLTAAKEWFLHKEK